MVFIISSVLLGVYFRGGGYFLVLGRRRGGCHLGFVEGWVGVLRFVDEWVGVLGFVEVRGGVGRCPWVRRVEGWGVLLGS